MCTWLQAVVASNIHLQTFVTFTYICIISTLRIGTYIVNYIANCSVTYCQLHATYSALFNVTELNAHNVSINKHTNTTN